MNQTKKIKWPEPSPEYINSLRDINKYKEEILNIYQQEFPVSTFISRLTDALEMKDNPNHGRRPDDFVRVRASDLNEILRQYDSMDNRLRDIHIDADLRSEPTIINMPNSIEKEEFIRNNPQALF